MTQRTPYSSGFKLKDIGQTYRTFIPDLKKYWKQFLLAYLALFTAVVMNLLKPWPDNILLTSGTFTSQWGDFRN